MSLLLESVKKQCSLLLLLSGKLTLLSLETRIMYAKRVKNRKLSESNKDETQTIVSRDKIVSLLTPA